jgi:RNA polymerase sigma-70 factor (ECF subfamily)
VPDGTPTWEEVARDHGRFLYGVAYRLVGNDADAQDLVQEALVRVRRGLETYTPGSLEGWLARIVTNVFLDEKRRRRRRPSVPVDDLERVGGSRGVHAPAPEDASEELSSELQRALAGLPEDFRVAVVLCDVVGLSYDEISVSQGIPVGTVRSRIHRGRRLLREALS